MKPSPATVSSEDLQHPRSVSAFRTARLLVVAYLTLSVLTVVAVVLLRNNVTMVTDAVWVRTVIVVASALLTFSFTVRAARGSRRAFLRLRLTSGIMLVAIVVIASLPGAFPVWLRIEQGACGLILLGVVLIVNGRHLRSLFARS
ncbi:hypothetical protein VSH64_44815 [Amycolatopsis rhabdoformis]|uniref:Integral membrane protein n=1 Tax=Amycolatopsis rhabdoformis TaxID=1448059 RepID=A0ABZ1I697_9PSEU|nr:hypothetical protein [Amycolatopsis rhabdoformis]WSE29840.1 hypothetical protein VSH64_44815 [Amycolatopsis rhabdoformis]